MAFSSRCTSSCHSGVVARHPSGWGTSLLEGIFPLNEPIRARLFLLAPRPKSRRHHINKGWAWFEASAIATGQTGVVKCVARPAAHMPKTGQGHSVHANFDRRKLMTLNNHRSVVVLPIFTPNTLLERACFELNENVLVLKMKQGTVKWQPLAGVQSWPKCWLSGSCPRAQCQRWWTLNFCHSVVSCLILKTEVSLKRRCFQQCPELENLIKYDAGWHIFFRGNAELNSSFPVNCTEASVDN